MYFLTHSDEHVQEDYEKKYTIIIINNFKMVTKYWHIAQSRMNDLTPVGFVQGTKLAGAGFVSAESVLSSGAYKVIMVDSGFVPAPPEPNILWCGITRLKKKTATP